MCLSIPAQIIKIKKNNEAIVQTHKNLTKVNISLMPKLKLRDWIIHSNGFAIRKISQKEAKEILNILSYT